MILSTLLDYLPAFYKTYRDASPGLSPFFVEVRPPAVFFELAVTGAPQLFARIDRGRLLAQASTCGDTLAKFLQLTERAYPFIAIIIKRSDDKRAHVLRLAHAVGCGGNLDFAMLGSLEEKIKEHLSDSLEVLASMQTSARITAACEEIEGAETQVKSYFKAAGTSAGTHAQARAHVKVLTSVSTSVEYATAKDFLEINTGSKGYAVFNLDGKGLGAHQYLLKAFFEHNRGTSQDPVIKFLRARENDFFT